MRTILLTTMLSLGVIISPRVNGQSPASIDSSVNDPSPPWNYREMWFDVVGYVHWGGWGMMGQRERDSARLGLPILTPFNHGLRRIGFNEEVKLLAWSSFMAPDQNYVERMDVAGIENKALLWVHYSLDSLGAMPRWRLMIFHFNTRWSEHAGTPYGWWPDWSAMGRWTAEGPTEEIKGADSVMSTAMRTFERPPTDQDVMTFLKDWKGPVWGSGSGGPYLGFFTIPVPGYHGTRFREWIQTGVCRHAWKEATESDPTVSFSIIE